LLSAFIFRFSAQRYNKFSTYASMQVIFFLESRPFYYAIPAGHNSDGILFNSFLTCSLTHCPFVNLFHCHLVPFVNLSPCSLFLFAPTNHSKGTSPTFRVPSTLTLFPPINLSLFNPKFTTKRNKSLRISFIFTTFALDLSLFLFLVPLYTKGTSYPYNYADIPEIQRREREVCAHDYRRAPEIRARSI